LSASTIDLVLTSAQESLCSVATSALAFDEAVVTERRVAVPTTLFGAMISIVGDTESIELAISSAPEVGQRLAKALLMEDGPGDLPESDVVDSLGEIANMIAGGVKKRLAPERPGLRLGLPLFVDGTVEGKRGGESAASIVRLGDADVHVIAYLHQSR
jgi:CheY-specific phosphatase CheX